MAPFLSLWDVKVLPKHCVSVCGISAFLLQCHILRHTHTERENTVGVKRIDSGGLAPLVHALLSYSHREGDPHFG